MTPSPESYKAKLRILIGLALGFVVGFVITVSIITNPYDVLGTLCVGFLVYPICIFAGGLIAGVTDKS